MTIVPIITWSYGASDSRTNKCLNSRRAQAIALVVSKPHAEKYIMSSRPQHRTVGKTEPPLENQCNSENWNKKVPTIMESPRPARAHKTSAKTIDEL